MLAILFATLLVGTFSSCSKDNDPKPEEESIIIGKWDVQNTNTTYGSFEFTNDKKYIIMQRTTSSSQGQSTGAKTVHSEVASQSFPRGMFFSTGTKVVRSEVASQPTYTIIFGDYSILSNDNSTITLNLSDFGTLSITTNPNVREATITVKGETYTVSKAEEMPSNDKTDLLCHTWAFSRYEIMENLVSEESKQFYIRTYGENWKNELEQEQNAEYKGMTVIFTKAGTYFINNPNDDYFNGSVASYWKWENIAEGIINYRHEDDGSGSATIIELTDKTLRVLERHDLTTLARYIISL